jgi:hypothetical protein
MMVFVVVVVVVGWMHVDGADGERVENEATLHVELNERNPSKECRT